MKNKKLKVIPLGGLGEVGKNMMVYEYGENILIVDTGLMFPDNDMLGIDYIVPDFSYLEGREHLVRGIIITHGHEDHTGAITHVLENINAPIYATPLTRGLLEVKLTRGKMLDRVQLNTVRAGDTVQIGPFKVEFFHVCHSIPDGVGLGITTPAGLIIHGQVVLFTVFRVKFLAGLEQRQDLQHLVDRALGLDMAHGKRLGDIDLFQPVLVNHVPGHLHGDHRNLGFGFLAKKRPVFIHVHDYIRVVDHKQNGDTAFFQLLPELGLFDHPVPKIPEELLGCFFILKY